MDVYYICLYMLAVRRTMRMAEEIFFFFFSLSQMISVEYLTGSD